MPDREVPGALAATVKFTVPLPVPPLPPVIVIQLAVLSAVQAQMLAAVTATLAVPPVSAIAWLAGAMVN